MFKDIRMIINNRDNSIINSILDYMHNNNFLEKIDCVLIACDLIIK